MTLEAQKVVRIGPYAKGELPQPLLITFKNADDTVINLTGFTADMVIVPVDHVDSGLGAGAATVESPETDGVTQYVFVAADMDTVGLFRAQMWVGDGANQRLGSDIYEYFVEEVTVAPNI